MVLAVTGFVLGGSLRDLKNHKQFYFFNVHYEYEEMWPVGNLLT